MLQPALRNKTAAITLDDFKEVGSSLAEFLSNSKVDAVKAIKGMNPDYVRFGLAGSASPYLSPTVGALSSVGATEGISRLFPKLKAKPKTKAVLDLGLASLLGGASGLSGLVSSRAYGLPNAKASLASRAGSLASHTAGLNLLLEPALLDEAPEALSTIGKTLGGLGLLNLGDTVANQGKLKAAILRAKRTGKKLPKNMSFLDAFVKNLDTTPSGFMPAAVGVNLGLSGSPILGSLGLLGGALKNETARKFTADVLRNLQDKKKIEELYKKSSFSAPVAPSTTKLAAPAYMTLSPRSLEAATIEKTAFVRNLVQGIGKFFGSGAGRRMVQPLRSTFSRSIDEIGQFGGQYIDELSQYTDEAMKNIKPTQFDDYVPKTPSIPSDRATSGGFSGAFNYVREGLGNLVDDFRGGYSQGRRGAVAQQFGIDPDQAETLLGYTPRGLPTTGQRANIPQNIIDDTIGRTRFSRPVGGTGGAALDDASQRLTAYQRAMDPDIEAGSLVSADPDEALKFFTGKSDALTDVRMDITDAFGTDTTNPVAQRLQQRVQRLQSGLDKNLPSVQAQQRQVGEQAIGQYAQGYRSMLDEAVTFNSYPQTSVTQAADYDNYINLLNNQTTIINRDLNRLKVDLRSLPGGDPRAANLQAQIAGLEGEIRAINDFSADMGRQKDLLAVKQSVVPESLNLEFFSDASNLDEIVASGQSALPGYTKAMEKAKDFRTMADSFSRSGNTAAAQQYSIKADQLEEIAVELKQHIDKADMQVIRLYTNPAPTITASSSGDDVINAMRQISQDQANINNLVRDGLTSQEMADQAIRTYVNSARGISDELSSLTDVSKIDELGQQIFNNRNNAQLRLNRGGLTLNEAEALEDFINHSDFHISNLSSRRNTLINQAETAAAEAAEQAARAGQQTAQSNLAARLTPANQLNRSGAVSSFGAGGGTTDIVTSGLSPDLANLTQRRNLIPEGMSQLDDEVGTLLGDNVFSTAATRASSSSNIEGAIDGVYDAINNSTRALGTGDEAGRIRQAMYEYATDPNMTPDALANNLEAMGIGNARSLAQSAEVNLADAKKGLDIASTEFQRAINSNMIDEFTEMSGNLVGRIDGHLRNVQLPPETEQRVRGVMTAISNSDVAGTPQGAAILRHLQDAAASGPNYIDGALDDITRIMRGERVRITTTGAGDSATSRLRSFLRIPGGSRARQGIVQLTDDQIGSLSAQNLAISGGRAVDVNQGFTSDNINQLQRFFSDSDIANELSTTVVRSDSGKSAVNKLLRGDASVASLSASELRALNIEPFDYPGLGNLIGGRNVAAPPSQIRDNISQALGTLNNRLRNPRLTDAQKTAIQNEINQLNGAATELQTYLTNSQAQINRYSEAVQNARINYSRTGGFSGDLQFTGQVNPATPSFSEQYLPTFRARLGLGAAGAGVAGTAVYGGSQPVANTYGMQATGSFGTSALAAPIRYIKKTAMVPPIKKFKPNEIPKPSKQAVESPLTSTKLHSFLNAPVA
tara:strand:- start:62850 stop:67349 length:4500 start_codon:yes stop_codon:yes gene_type:complete